LESGKARFVGRHTATALGRLFFSVPPRNPAHTDLVPATRSPDSHLGLHQPTKENRI